MTPRFSRAAWRRPLQFGALLAGVCAVRADPPIDTLVFGQPASESNHGLQGQRSEILAGALGQTARRLLAPVRTGWEGGRLDFTLQVDAGRQNYATIELWGGEANPNRLILLCEGRQIGYRPLGDIDNLDLGNDEPASPGRFFYNTSPLPLAMTRGHTTLHFEIRVTGPIWVYGTTFAQYQKMMTEASRGLYRLYIHTDGFFAPPSDEVRGQAPPSPPLRSRPGPEALIRLEARINREIDGELRASAPLSQVQTWFLARAYGVSWTHAFQNAEALRRIVAGLDALYRRYRQDPRLAEAEPSTYNPDWFGVGPAGDALRRLAGPLQRAIDQEIDDGQGGRIRRRTGYSAMLVACRDWHRRHRRLYSNQTMINDCYGIYLANRGIAAIDPAQALPEPEIRRYLYESVGLDPWLGSDTDSGPAKSAGGDYYEVTAKGLTRELGYVGAYGEVLDWAAQIYDATRPSPGEPGDPRIEAQLEKLARARGVFRYPALDAEGHPAMRTGGRDRLAGHALSRRRDLCPAHDLGWLRAPGRGRDARAASGRLRPADVRGQSVFRQHWRIA